MHLKAFIQDAMFNFMHIYFYEIKFYRRRRRLLLVQCSVYKTENKTKTKNDFQKKQQHKNHFI